MRAGAVVELPVLRVGLGNNLASSVAPEFLEGALDHRDEGLAIFRNVSQRLLPVANRVVPIADCRVAAGESEISHELVVRMLPAIQLEDFHRPLVAAGCEKRHAV